MTSAATAFPLYRRLRTPAADSVDTRGGAAMIELADLACAGDPDARTMFALPHVRALLLQIAAGSPYLSALMQRDPVPIGLIIVTGKIARSDPGRDVLADAKVEELDGAVADQHLQGGDLSDAWRPGIQRPRQLIDRWCETCSCGHGVQHLRSGPAA